MRFWQGRSPIPPRRQACQRAKCFAVQPWRQWPSLGRPSEGPRVPLLRYLSWQVTQAQNPLTKSAHEIREACLSRKRSRGSLLESARQAAVAFYENPAEASVLSTSRKPHACATARKAYRSPRSAFIVRAQLVRIIPDYQCNGLPGFLAAYPDIQIEIVAEVTFVDVLAAGLRRRHSLR